MSGTLAAGLNVRRRLLIISRSSSLHGCIDILEKIKDGSIPAPESSLVVSIDWKARELLWMLYQSLEDGMTFGAQPPVVK